MHKRRRINSEWVPDVPATTLMHCHSELMLLASQKEQVTSTSKDLYPPKPSEIIQTISTAFRQHSSFTGSKLW